LAGIVGGRWPRSRPGSVVVQIDGSAHAWLEDPGPACTLLVYVDDATSRLMELDRAGHR
jgi:hypothetical protein